MDLGTASTGQARRHLCKHTNKWQRQRKCRRGRAFRSSGQSYGFTDKSSKTGPSLENSVDQPRAPSSKTNFGTRAKWHRYLIKWGTIRHWLWTSIVLIGQGSTVTNVRKAHIGTLRKVTNYGSSVRVYWGGFASAFGFLGKRGLRFGCWSLASSWLAWDGWAFFFVVRISSSLTYPRSVALQDGGTKGLKGVPNGETTAVRSWNKVNGGSSASESR